MDTIEREIVIAAPVERVWDILTRPEHLGRWFGDAGAERHGDVITMAWKEHGSAELAIVREEPPHAFAYRWDANVPEAGQTLVEFTLEGTDAGTLLRMVESGFSALATSPDEQRRLREGNVRGWTSELGELQQYAQSVPV